MNPLQTLRVALRALARNKMRSFLTALGVIIGVAAVIAMVSIGEGAKAQVEASFASMGANVLIVGSGSSHSGGMRGGGGSQPTLTWDDLRAIQTEIPSVRAAAAQLRTNTSVLSDTQNWTTSVIGTSPEYFVARNWSVGSGVPMDQADVEGSTKVALLGQTVADMLFGADEDPLGRAVRIRNVPFTVTAVMSRKGQSPNGQDYDDQILIPQSTFMRRIQGGLSQVVSGIFFISAVAPEAAARAQAQISGLLRDRHRIPPDGEDDFSVRNLAEMAAAQQEGTDTMTTLLASIALVSLLVGGIGIMNIMLVSVTERTREIGLRMAVGARPNAILGQFLMEALVLSVGGGILGVGLGVGVAHRLAARFGWPLLIRPEVVLVVLGFSAAVGIVFGLYPARRASMLDPIDALRFE